MASWDTLVLFFIAAFILAYMPGPALFYATAQTLARGRRSGLMAALGLHLGGCVHIVAAVLGLSVVFNSVPVLYTALKLIGALYLIWLGIQLFRNARIAQQDLSLKVSQKSAKAAFIESITVEVLNPKTALFFIAFLPQFTDPSAALPMWAQFLVLGVITNLLLSSADLVCVLMAGVLVKRLGTSSTVQRLLQRIGGGILIGLGVNLALSNTRS